MMKRIFLTILLIFSSLIMIGAMKYSPNITGLENLSNCTIMTIQNDQLFLQCPNLIIWEQKCENGRCHIHFL